VDRSEAGRVSSVFDQTALPFLPDVLNNCEACFSWRNHAELATAKAQEIVKKNVAYVRATEAGVLLKATQDELTVAKRELAEAKRKVSKLELARTALPVPAEIVVNSIDIKEGVQIILDSLASSMDAGSGFLDYREWCAIRQVAYALGVVDLDELVGERYLGVTGQHVWPSPFAPLTDEPATVEENQ
jgi:hypothetical protein